MTKAEYIDFIRNSLPAMDKTRKYHREQVGIAINNAVNSVFWELYFKNPKKMAKSLERYSILLSDLTPTITVAGYRSRYVLSFNYDVVDLPRKTGGILEVLQLDGGANPIITTTTTNYVPVTTMEGEQFYGSEASLPGNVVGFSWMAGVWSNRYIEFWGMSAAEAAAGVSVRYIPQFSQLTATQEVLMPFGQDERIIEMVREFLGAIPPKDLVNDNADRQNG